MLFLLEPTDALACYDVYYPFELTKQDNRWVVNVNTYERAYYFRGGSFRLCSVSVYTKNKSLARFVQNEAAEDWFWKAIKERLGRYSCASLLYGRYLISLEATIAKTIRWLYWKKKRKRVHRPDVMIDIDVPTYAYCFAYP